MEEMNLCAFRSIMNKSNLIFCFKEQVVTSYNDCFFSGSNGVKGGPVKNFSKICEAVNVKSVDVSESVIIRYKTNLIVRMFSTDD